MLREIIILVLGILLIGFAFLDVPGIVDVGLTLAIGIVLVILSIAKMIVFKKERAAKIPQ